MSNLSPTVRITQSCSSYQFHNLIGGLNSGNWTIQKFMDKRGSSSLCLLNDILAIGFLAFCASDEDPHVLLVISNTWIGLAAVTLESGAVMGTIPLISVTDLTLQPSENLS
jgi:hypothetical protein